MLLEEKLQTGPLSAWITSSTSGPDLDLNDGITALQAFLRINFTGPAISKATLSWVAEDLSVDGLFISPLCSTPQLLRAAIECFDRANDKRWLGRSLVVHQALLEEPSNTLWKRLTDIYVLDDAEARKESPEFFAEGCIAYTMFDRVDEARKWHAAAVRASGLKYQVTGLMGRRTKFQQDNVLQLVCLAKSQGEVIMSSSAAPEPIELESDLFLEMPHLQMSNPAGIDEFLKNLDPNEPPALKNLDNALLLLLEEIERRTSVGASAILMEQRNCYVERVLRNPKTTVNWSILGRALWVRSLLESESPHTVERGMLQMESLVDHLGHTPRTYKASIDPESDNSRLEHIFELVPLPWWEMDIALAKRYMSLGYVKTAIEVYERLNLWADAALCYALIGQESYGLKILDRHLEQHPTDARSWSIKGDITQCPQFWQKAWDVGRYAPSKRALGRYYFSPPKLSGIERDITRAVAELREALNVNSLHYDTWFLCGCIFIELQNWEEAAEAFTHCIVIKHDDPKCWSNLASALLKLGKKEQAFNALGQALRVDLNETADVRIWSNHVIVAADLGRWEDVVSGFNQILQSRQPFAKYVNPALLLDVVEAFTKSPYEGTKSQDKLVRLIVEILPMHINDQAMLWKLVAKVSLWCKQQDEALKGLEKSYRIYINSPDIGADKRIWHEAVESCCSLSKLYSELARDGDGSWRFKAKSMVNNLLGKGQASWKDTQEYKNLLDIKAEL